ncbi:hypothetical protein TWF281_004392 [Arthrobotrys megalospora]
MDAPNRENVFSSLPFPNEIILHIGKLILQNDRQLFFNLMRTCRQLNNVLAIELYKEFTLPYHPELGFSKRNIQGLLLKNNKGADSLKALKIVPTPKSATRDTDGCWVTVKEDFYAICNRLDQGQLQSIQLLECVVNNGGFSSGTWRDFLSNQPNIKEVILAPSYRSMFPYMVLPHALKTLKLSIQDNSKCLVQLAVALKSSKCDLKDLSIGFWHTRVESLDIFAVVERFAVFEWPNLENLRSFTVEIAETLPHYIPFIRHTVNLNVLTTFSLTVNLSRGLFSKTAVEDDGEEPEPVEEELERDYQRAGQQVLWETLQKITHLKNLTLKNVENVGFRNLENLNELSLLRVDLVGPVRLSASHLTKHKDSLETFWHSYEGEGIATGLLNQQYQFYTWPKLVQLGFLIHSSKETYSAEPLKVPPTLKVLHLLDDETDAPPENQDAVIVQPRSEIAVRPPEVGNRLLISSRVEGRDWMSDTPQVRSFPHVEVVSLTGAPRFSVRIINTVVFRNGSTPRREWYRSLLLRDERLKKWESIRSHGVSRLCPGMNILELNDGIL